MGNRHELQHGLYEPDIDQIRAMTNFYSQIPHAATSVKVAVEVTDTILSAFEAPNHLERAGLHPRSLYRCKDWATTIRHVNPTVLDLACGAGRTSEGEVAKMWLPGVPLILGTHGANPQHIIGVDIHPFHPAEGVYTHIQADLTETAKNNDLSTLLEGLIPKEGFHAVIINNSELWATGPIRYSLISQARHLLRDDGVIVEEFSLYDHDGTFIRNI